MLLENVGVSQSTGLFLCFCMMFSGLPSILQAEMGLDPEEVAGDR